MGKTTLLIFWLKTLVKFYLVSSIYLLAYLLVLLLLNSQSLKQEGVLQSILLSKHIILIR